MKKHDKKRSTADRSRAMVETVIGETAASHPDERRFNDLRVAAQEWIFDFANGGILVMDQDLKIRKWNAWMEDRTGRKAGEVLGKDFFELYPELKGRGIERYYRDAMAGDCIQLSPRLQRFFIPMPPTVEGRSEYMQQSVKIAPLRSGVNMVGTITVIEDVTERLAREDELGRSLSELRTILDLAPIGIAICLDPFGRRIVLNRYFSNLTGVPQGANASTRARLEGGEIWFRIFRNGKELTPDETPMQIAIKTGREIQNTEIDILRRDGFAVSMTGNVSPLFDERGMVRGAIGAFLNTTELKKSQEAVKEKTEELARSNRELEDFASIVSHDLQSPLNRIFSFADLVRVAVGESNEQVILYLDRIQASTQRMRDLVRSLLNYARISKEKEPVEVVPLNDVVREVLEDLDERIRAEYAAIKVSPLPHVRGRRVQLRQVFQNLIGNALKFRGPDPPEIVVTARKENGSWKITVQDNGIGIEPQYSRRIFEIFQRLHPASEYPGVGVGLAVCKKIIEMHGGHIWFESEPGKGSKFIFTIPEEPSPPQTG